jgi:hypothetical protein
VEIFDGGSEPGNARIDKDKIIGKMISLYGDIFLSGN